MSKQQFVHLHVHSHYSLLDGLGKVDELVKKAVEHEMPALALTDHGVMYGAIDFYNSCKKAGIKPIIGQEAYVAPRKMTDKSSGVDTKPYHMVLLAKNFTGYKNLIKLTSAAHLEGYYYKPRIDRELLSKHSEGIIATSACLASETSRLILDKQFDKLEETVRTYQDIFGKDHYYLELQHHSAIAEQQVVNTHIRELSKKTGIPLIVTNDAHYVNSGDSVAHDQLVCIQTGRLVSDTNRMVYTSDFSLKSSEEMAQAFPDLPEAMTNTVKIADMVDIDIPLGQSLLPKFPLPEGETEESLLRKWCEQGAIERYGKITNEIKERLNFELDTVIQMGFPGYFLITADLVRFAKSKGIVVGPGRGSAAGSILAYTAGITNVDPLKYGLLFERFLDPSRISMPDIDMDFEDVRRGEVIDYVRHKYGDNHVAGIITFGTIMARAAVRDVGRVLGMPYTQVDAIAKTVPAPIQGRHMPLSKSVKEAPELKELYNNDPEAKLLLDSAMKLEGTIRHASQHACAIVISKDPLDNYVSVQQSQGGDVHQVTQYSMEPIEKIGLLKMDFLGLSNLTIMRKACEIIEATYGEKIDIYNIPLDDKKTFGLFGRGETTGVFQLESSGMKRYIKELKPNQFEDIVAMVALYRPGPMQWIQSFIDRKNGKEAVTYLHPLAENALKETYGIPLYQEQVMRMSKDMSGFTGSEADVLRKAIGKKIPKLLAEMKEKFISGAMNNGVKEAKAAEIWKQLEDFAAYCFNKSHAVCYALIAYQTAYLKSHYPDCFMAALMTSDLDNIDRLSIEILECERIGIKVLSPDVNESFSDFGVVKGEKAIRFGLSAIKNVGTNVAKGIVKERKTNGLFSSLENFLERCSTTLNKKVLESLVKSGALDRFNDRKSLYAGMELITKYASGFGKNNSANQLTMFGDESHHNTLAKLELPEGVEDTAQFLAWEKELLGLYLSSHPLKQFSEILEKNTTPINELSIEMANKVVRVGGVIIEVKKITTKSNQTMAFVQIEDLTGLTEVIVFPTIFKDRQEFWVTDKLVVVEGKISDKDGTVKVLADKVWLVEQLEMLKLPPVMQNGSDAPRRSNFIYKNAEQTKKLPVEKIYTIDLPRTVKREQVEALKIVLGEFKGTTPVELRVMQGDQVKVVPTKSTVKVCDELKEKVREVLQLPVS
ncbi:DNA polymerase III subunit alpha [Candidatus Berkelbacteria bacterium]|nr:DNA polymerase III subunit alpha [Candidatus Berkelbacteria bacterium]